ncbi:S-adenosyl-L-methionine-dependent methyltransferase [Fennellomyces sp. T-0311]|nr:S-adenosyl-L-methionine-dependent methyltransferase [Fennellomyces sp. T-0311]
MPTQLKMDLLEVYTTSYPIKILEVGCGPGHFSALLKAELQDSIDITAIDASELEIKECAKHNVPNTYIQSTVQQLDLTKYRESFDVILFTKSLHHCDPLDETLEQAYCLLKNNGIVVVEEFVREYMDEASATWFFDRTDLLKTGNHMQSPTGPYTNKIECWNTVFDRSKGTPYKRWQQLFAHYTHSYNGEEVMSTDLMKRSLMKAFGEKANLKAYENQVYLSSLIMNHGLEDTMVGKAVLELIMEQEARAIKDGTLKKGTGTTFVIQKHEQ